MKKTGNNTVLMLLVIAGVVTMWGCNGADKGPERIMLFNGKDLSGWTFYLNEQSVSPDAVWQVRDGIIYCQGKPNGYMRTQQDYRNYMLHLEWRWPGEGGNSGVLLHMSGEDKVWPKSIECQLHSTNAGDFWFIDGTDSIERTDKSSRRLMKQQSSSEKPLGQWNSYDIVCRGNSIKPYVNSILQNNATQTSVSSGKICLQSEGKPIEFRNIYLVPLN